MNNAREDVMDNRNRNPESAPAAEAVDEGRRGFLRTAGLAGAGAAAATVTGADPAEAQRFPPEPGTTRYRLTPHIERFYALNRL
jgi:hypothetical protein